MKNIKIHIKKGDTVEVLTGESKGQRGRVIKVVPEKYTAYVEGEGIRKASRHSKPTSANPQGGIVHKDVPINISNLMLVDSKGTKSRVGYKKDETGKKVRYSRKTQEVI